MLSVNISVFAKLVIIMSVCMVPSSRKQNLNKNAGQSESYAKNFPFLFWRTENAFQRNIFCLLKMIMNL